MNDEFLPYSELYRRIQASRAQHGLPPLQNRNSLCARLHLVRRTGVRGHQLYSLSDALHVFCTMHTQHTLPWNRLGTAAEIASRLFMPLSTAVHAYRCHRSRFDSAIHSLDLLAWIHPETGARWVHIEQAAYVAQWRSLAALRRYLTAEQLHHITSTRPYRASYTADGYTQRTFFVPEYSHLGGLHTTYRPRSAKRGQKNSKKLHA